MENNLPFKSKKRSKKRKWLVKKPPSQSNQCLVRKNQKWIWFMIKRLTILKNREASNGRNNKRWMKLRSQKRRGWRRFRKSWLKLGNQYMGYCLLKNRSLWSVRMIQGRRSGSCSLLFWRYIIAFLYLSTSVLSHLLWQEFSLWYSTHW